MVPSKTGIIFLRPFCVFFKTCCSFLFFIKNLVKLLLTDGVYIFPYMEVVAHLQLVVLRDVVEDCRLCGPRFVGDAAATVAGMNRELCAHALASTVDHDVPLH